MPDSNEIGSEQLVGVSPAATAGVPPGADGNGYPPPLPEPPLVDIDQVLRTWQTLVAPEQVVEVRLLDARYPGDYRPSTLMGYFNDPQALAMSLAAVASARGCYFTPNPVDPSLLARTCNRLSRAERGVSTSDRNITARRWLLIDIDPQRPAGISSTEAEHDGALQRAIAVMNHLSDSDFPTPVIADSGNGAHLMYRVDLPVDDEGLVSRVLQALATLFNDADFAVDTTVCNPARIWRLYGTASCKGDHMADRPHRMSRILAGGDELVVVDRELLEVLAEPARSETPASPPRSSTAPGRPFDIEPFIEQNNLELDGPEPYEGGRRWTFRRSPMCEHDADGPFLIQFASGALSAGCHHASCSWGWTELRARFESSRRAPQPTPNESGLPTVTLPGAGQTITETAERLGTLLAETETHFSRGGVVVRSQPDARGQSILLNVKPAELASSLEQVASLVAAGGTGSVACSEAIAKLILSADAFVTQLPPLRTLSHCPVLIERDGRLVTVTGYDRGSGVLAVGDGVDELTLPEATELLLEVVAGFQFATPADHSRALAAMITPALVFGSLLLPGRAPIDLGEADQSQAGKGYRNKLTAAIYRTSPFAVTMRRKGVGGLEEAFDRALITGRPMISLDNVRGNVDLPAVESFMTEDSYAARTAYSPVTEIDPRRVILMFTSNRAEMTVDLANRSSCVRIVKHGEGHVYPSYPEGGMLEHIIANQPRYLGAVFAVIRAWHAAGRARTEETRHDFRIWAQTLDWIVQNIFGAAPLMEAHRETQWRISNPALNWLRDVAIAIERSGRMGRWLIATDVMHILDEIGGVEIPGVTDGGSIDDEQTQRAALQQIGRRLGRAFGSIEQLTFERFIFEREAYRDDCGRNRHQYRLTTAPTEA